VRRAPPYLRAVKGKRGGMDVLDQIEDTPADSETVYVYEREGLEGWMHVRGRGFKGYYALANYHYLPDADGQELRDNTTWQDWATKRHNVKIAGDGKVG
jgi:hypothetical protein